MTKKVWIILFILSASCAYAFDYPFFWKSDIKYKSLGKVICYYDKDKRDLIFTCTYGESFLDIIDYDVRNDKKRRDIYYLKLKGKHYEKAEDYFKNLNKQIETTGNVIKISINLKDYKVIKDTVYYVDSDGNHEIKVLPKEEGEKKIQQSLLK
jgi:hypothetical protein